MDTPPPPPPLMYKSIHVTFVFWVPKTPPTPYMSGTSVLAPPPPDGDYNACKEWNVLSEIVIGAKMNQ